MMLYEEGETLEGVLSSLRPIADRFILGVDRASTDATARIARDHADDYFEFDFHNHFSEVRNEVLRRCKTTWFFQVDGHEFLSAESLPCIEETKRLSRDRAAMIDLGLYIWDEWEPILLYYVPRLFRADYNIFYTRAIHNTLTCQQGHDHFLALPKLTDPGIILDHKQPEARHEKRAAQRRRISIPGIVKQAAEKDDAYDWYNLGIMQTYQEDVTSAIQSFEKTLELCERNDARYQTKLHLGGLYKHIGDRVRAKEVLSSAMINDPSRCEHFVELGALYEEEGRDDEALVFYGLATHYSIPTSQMTLHIPYYTHFPLTRMMKIYGRKGNLKNAIEVGEKLRTCKYFRHQGPLESYLEQFHKRLQVTTPPDKSGGFSGHA